MASQSFHGAGASCNDIGASGPCRKRPSYGVLARRAAIMCELSKHIIRLASCQLQPGDGLTSDFDAAESSRYYVLAARTIANVVPFCRATDFVLAPSHRSILHAIFASGAK